MADQALPLPVRVFDENGLPVAAARATFFASGTNTLIDVFDADGALLTNPVIADGNGVLPQTFVDPSAKVVLSKPSGAIIATLDPVAASVRSGAAASSISFAPTPNIPFSTVQAAMEGVDASLRAIVSGAGIGLTADASLIGSIDATTIPSGEYRFDGTTTGTFPSGVTAATTGQIDVGRQSATQATMSLRPANSTFTYERQMVGGTWGAWREIISVPNPTARGDLALRGASAWTRLAVGGAMAGLRVNVAGTEPEWTGPGPVVGTVATPTTSTPVAFTGVPAGTTRMTLTFNALSLAGTDNLLIQLGDAGGFETTGYTGGTRIVDTASNVTSTSGFAVAAGNAGYGFTGTVEIVKHTGNVWVFTATGFESLTNFSSIVGGGAKTLSDVLTQVRVTTTGTDAFDGGTVNIAFG